MKEERERDESLLTRSGEETWRGDDDVVSEAVGWTSAGLGRDERRSQTSVVVKCSKGEMLSSLLLHILARLFGPRHLLIGPIVRINGDVLGSGDMCPRRRIMDQ